MKIILRSLIAIFVLMVIFNCNWYDNKSRYITINNNKNKISDKYKTTKDLLLVNVKQNKFDLLGLNKIIFSDMIKSYHIKSYIISPDKKDKFTKYLIGEILDTKIIPKGSIVQIDDIQLSLHECSYLFIPLTDSTYFSLIITMGLKTDKKCKYNLKEFSHCELVYYFSNSLDNLNNSLKEQSYVVNIPYLRHTRTRKVYEKNIKIPFLHAEKHLRDNK